MNWRSWDPFRSLSERFRPWPSCNVEDALCSKSPLSSFSHVQQHDGLLARGQITDRKSSSFAHEPLQDFDRHIENLRAQLQFLNEGLDATDHNAPDWLATDLISLRNKSGRLQDDMKRFRDQLQSEGLAVKKVRRRLRSYKADADHQRPKPPTSDSVLKARSQQHQRWRLTHRTQPYHPL